MTSTPPGDTQPHLPRQPARPPAPEPPPRSLEINGDVSGDVVGGDVHRTTRVEGDLISGPVVTTTQVGFSAAAVQRLVISVGLLVFATAACFFSGGVVLGGAAIAALNRPVASDDPVAAREFGQALGTLRSLPPGTPFTFTFTEEQISAYFRQEVAPTLPGGITDGRVRLLESGVLVVGGRIGQLGGLPFAATFERAAQGGPLEMRAAAVHVLRLGRLPFGWVAVPTGLLGGVEDAVNGLLGGVIFTSVDTSPTDATWTVEGITR